MPLNFDDILQGTTNPIQQGNTLSFDDILQGGEEENIAQLPEKYFQYLIFFNNIVFNQIKIVSR